MGIEGNFLDVIKAMYMYSEITSHINGRLLEKIKITRSVKQGCSLSMLLFVLSSVPVLNMILSK